MASGGHSKRAFAENPADVLIGFRILAVAHAEHLPRQPQGRLGQILLLLVRRCAHAPKNHSAGLAASHADSQIVARAGARGFHGESEAARAGYSKTGIAPLPYPYALRMPHGAANAVTAPSPPDLGKPWSSIARPL